MVLLSVTPAPPVTRELPSVHGEGVGTGFPSGSSDSEHLLLLVHGWSALPALAASASIHLPYSHLILS